MYIYALADPRTNELRYVGRSVNPKRRLLAHIHTSNIHKNENPQKEEWIRTLLTQGLRPSLLILEEVSVEEGPDKETEHIKRMKSTGHSLTNLTDGGVGYMPGELHPHFGKHWDSQFKEKVAEGVRRYYKTSPGSMKGKKMTAEQCQRISASKVGTVSWNKGKHFTKEQRKNISESLLGLLVRSKNGRAKKVVRLSDGKQYDCIMDCADDNGVTRITIKNHCMGYASNPRFRYANSL